MNLKACRKEKGLRETVEIGGEEGGREVEGGGEEEVEEKDLFPTYLES